MNILCDELPDYILCDGEKYKVKTDFKVWLKFYTIINDRNLSGNEKLMLSILCCLDAKNSRHLPPNGEKMMKAMLDFFAGDTKNKKSHSEKKVFDFTEDSEYIFAAFLQEYGIDLTDCEMHWYKFLALLKGLGENCELVKIIGYRSMDLSEIHDKEKQKYFKKIKKMYALTNDLPLSGNEIAERIAMVF